MRPRLDCEVTNFVPASASTPRTTGVRPVQLLRWFEGEALPSPSARGGRARFG